MRYSDGQAVRVGDKVKLGQDTGGVVVCSLDRDEFADGYLKSEWEHLKRGVLINFPQFGLIHYEELEPDVELIERPSRSAGEAKPFR